MTSWIVRALVCAFMAVGCRPPPASIPSADRTSVEPVEVAAPLARDRNLTGEVIVAADGWTCIEERGRWSCLGGRGPEGTRAPPRHGRWSIDGKRPIVQMAIDPEAARSCALEDVGRLWCTRDVPFGLLRGEPLADDATHVATNGDHICYARNDGDLVCRAPERNEWVVIRLPSAVVEVATSTDSVCGRLRDGSVACMRFRQLRWSSAEPEPTTFGPHAAPFVPGVQGATRLSASMNAFAAIVPSKVAPTTELMAWVDRGTMQPVVLENTRGVSAFALGAVHMCTAASGRLQCRGDNSFGALGTGTYARSEEFEPVVWPEAIGHVTHVVAGRRHTCARTVGGRVACFGDGRSGAFGLQVRAHEDAFERIDATAGPFQYTDVAAGRAHACATALGGLVLCWGANDQGQLGGGRWSSATPRVVRDVVDARAVAAAGDRTCVIRRGGSISCWGNGARGPHETFSVAATSIELGTDRACILRPNGRIACWAQTAERLTPSGSLQDLAGVNGAEAIALRDDVLCYAKDRALHCSVGNGPFRPIEGAKAWAVARGQVMSACLGPTYGCAPSKGGGAVCFDLTEARASNGVVETTVHTFPPHEGAVDAVVCGERAYARMHLGAIHALIGPPDWRSPPSALNIARGADFECMLDETLVVECRGDQRYGQLGRGVQAFASTPVVVPFSAN